MSTKPYSVWVKMEGRDWRMLFESHVPNEAHEFAQTKVYHGGPVERVEVRDLTGPIATVFDRSWRRND